jgi:hypothetical protein
LLGHWFLPDVFVYPIVGHWQDTLPAEDAYRNMWLMGLAALCMVILFTFLLFRKIRRADAAPENEHRWPRKRLASDGENLKENNNVKEIHHWNRWREPEHQSRDVRSAGKCGL